MQPEAQQNTHKKRKNIYNTDAEEETSGSHKKRKIDLGGPSSFINLQSHAHNEHPYVAYNNNPMTERPEDCSEQIENSLAVQIHNFKLKKSTKQRAPDPKLLQLLNAYMNARKILQRDAAKQIPCAHCTLSQYRNSHVQKWSHMEARILNWMKSDIDHIIINTPFDFNASGSVPNSTVKFSSNSPATIPIENIKNTNTAPIISGQYNADKFNEVQPTKSMPTSAVTLLSTPEYLRETVFEESNPLSNLPLAFISLPQSLRSLQLETIELAYLSLPKDIRESQAFTKDVGIASGTHVDFGKLNGKPKNSAWIDSDERIEFLQGTQENENLGQIWRNKSAEVSVKENSRPERENSTYSSMEAAVIVLKKFGKPLHVKEIARICVKEGYIRSTCKTIDKSIAGVIYRDLKNGHRSHFKKVSEGVFTINTG